jgi:hypothetical protein
MVRVPVLQHASGEGRGSNPTAVHRLVGFCWAPGVLRPACKLGADIAASPLRQLIMECLNRLRSDPSLM